MTRSFRWPFIVLLAFTAVRTSSAQVKTGTPPFGSFGGGPDVINLANLNSQIAIPAIHKPGRGLNFSYDLTYNSSVWYPVGVSGSQTWQPVWNWGWAGQTQVTSGYIDYSVVHGSCNLGTPQDPYIVAWNRYTFRYFHDQFGGLHYIGAVVSDNGGQCPNDNSPGDATVVLNDGSGFTIYVAAGPNATVYPKEGGSILPPLQAGTGATTVTDRNGNKISVSSGGVFTDTLGTAALTVSGAAPNPVSLAYKNAGGTSVSVTMYYQAYTVKTNFAIGISEYGPTNISLVDHITLPNGKQYAFTYEQTPGTCTPLTGTFQGYCVTARIASVTLPMGGTITYAYSGGSNGIFSDGSTATLTRTTPDGQWIYARTLGTGAASTTTVTDPQNNQTVIQFQGIYETERRVYSGSSQTGTLLQTVDTCYNAAASPCTGTAITLPINRRTVIVQLDSSGPQFKTDLFLNSYGLPTEADEYDYGIGAPGPLVRRTRVTYASLGNGIVNRPATITVCTASGSSSSCTNTGTQIAQTTITYDEGTITPTSGVPQHVAVTGSRGNPTTIKQWISGATYATSTFTYYDTGNALVTTDPGLHQTTFSYADSWGDSACPPPANTQAFPTQITNALNQNTQIKYYQCMAQVHSVKDPNDIANVRNGTVFTYADSFSRLTRVDFPDGGQTTLGYDDTARTFTTTQKQTATVSVSETDQFDVLGRLTQRQLPGSRKVDTSYDSLGRVWKTSNPYVSTSDPTYGLSEIQYDPLGRVKKLIRQDATSTTLFEYSGNVVRVTDDSGKKRLAVADALGRVAKVCEVTAGNTRSPNEACGISGFTESGYVTTNAYDVLDDLTQIVQGTAAPQQQTRTMSYDGLGRITNARILEVSTTTDVTYGYDLESNRTSVTDPRSTVNFEYDAVHRLLRKKHGTTTVAEYTYDGTAANNAIGRLITDTDGVAGSGADRSDYSYDALGRVLTANRTVSATAYNIGYQYDLMGNLTQLTYPSGRKVSYTYAASNELSKVSDVTSTSFDYVTGTTYSALGTLQQLSLANQVSTTLGWNNLARLTSILTQESGSPALLNLGYSYFANGQIQQITNNLDSLKTEKYAYDDLARLLTAQRGPDTNIQRKYSYDYDRFGNRWAQNVVAGSGLGGTNTFNYASNRVTSTGFSYDTSGNVTANGAGTSYTFNPENFITAAGASVTYSVDTLGRRAKKTVSGVTTNYFYSGSVVISESQGTTWTDYIFFGNQRIAQQTGSTLTAAKFLHQDHLGSTRVGSDGSGNSAGSCDYEPFGEFQPGSSCSNLPTNYRFAGMEYDSETGLYHTIFRQYDPNQGRWLSVDPLPGSPDNPQSGDRYAYVLNDPLGLVDPLGLDDDCGGPCTPFSYTDSSGCTVYVTYHKEEGPDGEIYDMPDVTTVCSICPIGDRPGPVRCLDPQHTPEVVPYRILRRLRLDLEGSFRGFWQRTKTVNRCAGELSQAGSVSSLSGGRVPRLLGSNTFGDIASLVTGSGDVDQAGALAAHATAHAAPSLASQVAVGTATSIGTAISHTSGVYNPMTVGTTTITAGMTTVGKVTAGVLEGVLTGKVLLDAGVYVGALVVCSEE